MKKTLLFGTLTIFLLTGCIEEKGKIEDVEVSRQFSNPEVITEELMVPWSITKWEDTFYITERPGSIVKIENGKKIRQKVELEKNLATTSEAGLLGFVLSPNFSQSNLAFAYYTYRDSAGQFNRIVQLHLEDEVWREKEFLLDKIPSGSVHHGGRLKIGPDGKLYATTGDAAESSIAQSLRSLGGKILRINLDGSIPSDNPFPDSYIYSYGHRNPQGMTWSSDGTLYASEHGNSANDEINKIEAGKNYGWPIIEGMEEREGMITPLFTSGKNNTWAPSGMGYFDEKVYVASLRGSAVLEFDLITKNIQRVNSDFGRIRDIFIEGNDLYFISNNTDGRGTPQQKDDKLYRISLLEEN